MTERRPRPGHTPRARLLTAGLVCVLTAIASGQLRRDPDRIDEIQGVTVTERLGEKVPTQLGLTDSTGETVLLGDMFDGERPVVLALVYYACPVVCPLVMDRMTNCFRELDYGIGEDFRVVMISIDHTEGPTESGAAKMRYTGAYVKSPIDRDAAAVQDGWRFMTGDEHTVRAIADAAGWGYKRLPNGEYSHPSAFMVLSPDGTLTRYIYGFDYPPKQIKLSLLDASEGRIAESLGDKIMFYCYRFDPTAGAYTMEAMAVMRIAGIATVIGLGGLIGGLLLFEHLKRKKTEGAGHPAAA